MNPESRHPLIFDIHRFALDDGPGIRTTVFFKGCPLSCIWCHNPEGMRSEPELRFNASKCIQCGDCVSVCHHGSISLNDSITIDRTLCDAACGRCAVQCPAKALSIKGQYYSIDELVNLLLQDKRFYDNSNGGVTFSGGEPTQDLVYLSRVMQALKYHGIHIALQTCGLFNWNEFQTKLLPWIDLIYFDIKCIDPDLHRQWTGQSNEQILINFSKLAGMVREKLICTIPLITGLTANNENIQDLAHHICSVHGLLYELRPYHPGARFKAAELGITTDENLPLHAMSPDEYHQIAADFDSIVNNLQKRR